MEEVILEETMADKVVFHVLVHLPIVLISVLNVETLEEAFLEATMVDKAVLHVLVHLPIVQVSVQNVETMETVEV